ncbi:hypothetical protein ELY21_02450 [Legionella sp. km535]|nr:hypothetical protein ELY21_02450 [Legionella sp. km535]
MGTSLFSLPNVNWNNQFKNGFDLNAAAGYHLNTHWRAETEFLYQNMKRNSYGSYGWMEQNSVTGAVYAQQFYNPISTTSTKAHLYSFLTNASYDFNSLADWTPFIGGGIGVSWLKSGRVQTNNLLAVDDPNTPIFEIAPASQLSPSLYGTAFIWQLKTGIARAMNAYSSLLIQYRLLGTSDFKASNSLIKSNPGLPGESNFYIAQHDIKGLLTQAVEINFRWDV